MKTFTCILTACCLYACNNNMNDFDATGTFEANEVIISAEASGKILSFVIEEGQMLKAGQQVGFIDSTQLHLSKLQLLENQKAVLAGKPDIRTQIEATKKEIDNVKLEKKRVENLVKGGVATQKQLDDVDSKLAVLEARLAAQQNSLTVTTTTLNEQSGAIKVQLAMVTDQLSKCLVTNPVDGTVLTKYAMQDEMTAPGKGLYKIADLSTLILRAYISGTQLPQIKLGQAVQVYVDSADGEYKTYPGTITWISDKAEFTPKTIQTKDERANLVYAIKISVKNDGYLKLGMYGEVKLNSNSSSPAN
ncbi:MAG TPA: HlyD family efflux transporter periplasmic adaptor subunit [Cyclobacteriaceae bacterium]|nr:HlyD family efflux transporter periplasmic adaptor subunit [Cyclobacteriaceae bacterium]